nr:MAG TPA: hypothetical protein [Caudoviricetes sp.]
MLSFLKHVRDVQPVRVYNKMNDIRRTIHDNHRLVVEYWREMNWIVRSEHILVGVINSLRSEADFSLAIYNSVKDLIPNVVTSRGIGSSYHYARIQPKSHFYGQGCEEIYIEQGFDDAYHQMLTKPYYEWQPIRVCSHPFTSFDFQLPNGKPRTSGERGRCIIKFDLALLYTQYKYWLNDESRSRYEDGTAKLVANFIHSIALPGMLASHVDIAWFNRLFNLSQGLAVSNEREDGRLMMSSPYYYVDETHQRMLTDLERSRANFHEWCCWLPGIFTKNLKSLYTQDNTLESQQIKLPWSVSRLSLLSWLFRLDMEFGSGKNTQYRNEYLKQIREYKNSRIFGTLRGCNPKELERQFDEYITVFADT